MSKHVADDGQAIISAEEFDRLFDDGEVDILQYCDLNNIRRPGQEARTVAVDLPAPVFDAVERESSRTGTTVESLIEAWVEERVGLGV